MRVLLMMNLNSVLTFNLNLRTGGTAGDRLWDEIVVERGRGRVLHRDGDAEY